MTIQQLLWQGAQILNKDVYKRQPHNPVSRVWSEEELDTMFDICRRHGVLVVSDEIHQDFTYEGKKFVSSALVGDGKYKDILITLNAGSKTFNLAGLIHSHVIIFDKQLMETYDAVSYTHLHIRSYHILDR